MNLLKLKNLISRWTKPKGLFYDGFTHKALEYNPSGDRLYDWCEYQTSLELPYRYENYYQNKWGWWVKTNNITRSSVELKGEEV